MSGHESSNDSNSLWNTDGNEVGNSEHAARAINEGTDEERKNVGSSASASVSPMTKANSNSSHTSANNDGIDKNISNNGNSNGGSSSDGAKVDGENTDVSKNNDNNESDNNNNNSHNNNNNNNNSSNNSNNGSGSTNVEVSGGAAAGNSNSNVEKDSNHNNDNHSMLNFHDDYAGILNNLTNGNNRGNMQPQSQSQSRQNNDGANTDKNSSGMDKGTLDMLLQHYQELLNKSNSAANSPQFAPSVGPSNTTPSPNISARPQAAEKPCDHCRRRQNKCIMTPGAQNCVPCDTKGIKCTFSEIPSGKTAADVLQKQMSKRDRVDENINVHELLKRTKFGNVNYNNNNDVSHNVPNVKTNDMPSDSSQNLPMQFYNDAIQSWLKSQSSSSEQQQPAYPYPRNISEFNDSANNGNNTNNSSQKVSPSSVYDFNQFSYGQTPNFPVNSNHQNFQSQINYAQPAIQYPRSSYFVGPTSIFDINLINHMKLDKIEQVQLSKNLALRKVSPTAQFILRDDFNQELYLKQEHDIDLVEKLVHPHGKILVEIFFKLIHPYFPILHERVFLEKYSRSYRELTAPILASIYSLALQWWDFHPQLIGFPKPDVVKQLNDIALKTFYEVFERPKLSIVQAGLLILHCRSECPNNWVLCSEIVALSEELGLGVDCQDWRLPRWERGLRRRLAWAVWCVDKWCALLESRHSHLILGRNWMVKLLTEEDFPDKSPIISSSQRNKPASKRPLSPIGNSSILDISPTDEDFNNGKLLFRQMVSLSIILGEIMDTFYTIGAMKTTTKIEHVLKLAKPLQLKLREWYHSLPHRLSMNNYAPGNYNSNATLTLAYFAAEITLHRKIISTLSPESPEELIPVCRTAAKTRLIAAIEFIRDLKTEHINSFWYTCSTGNLALIGTFSALLYVTAPTKDEALIFRDCLRNYVWILRMSSKSFERAGNALDRIHMLLTQIPGLLTDEPVTQPFVPPKSQSPYNPSSSYNAPPPPPSNPQPPQQNQQGHSQQQFFGSGQSPYYSSPQANFEMLNNSNFKQLKNLPPEVLQSLSNIQSNMPSIPSASFSELNEFLEMRSKTPKLPVSNQTSNSLPPEPLSQDKSPHRIGPLAVNEKTKLSKNPITPSSATGTTNSNTSPAKFDKQNSPENEINTQIAGPTDFKTYMDDKKINSVREESHQ